MLALLLSYQFSLQIESDFLWMSTMLKENLYGNLTELNLPRDKILCILLSRFNRGSLIRIPSNESIARYYYTHHKQRHRIECIHTYFGANLKEISCQMPSFFPSYIISYSKFRHLTCLQSQNWQNRHSSERKEEITTFVWSKIDILFENNL